MVKNHLKSIAAPKRWFIERKSQMFLTKPRPGAHSMEYGMSLSLIMRKVVKVAKTAKEAKQVINTKEVLVDNKRRKDARHVVGLMDVVAFPDLKENYRVILDEKGRITARKIDDHEAGSKLARIEGKTKINSGRIQLHLSDGRNLLVDASEHTVGDTVHIELPSQKIIAHYPFKKGAAIFLIGGKHAGSNAVIDEISEGKIIFTTPDQKKFETLKKYAYIVGDKDPAQKCFENK